MSVMVKATMKDNKVWLSFPFDYSTISQMKRWGARFYNESKGGPAWVINADFDILKQIRKSLGSYLSMDETLYTWAAKVKNQRETLKQLAEATTAELVNLPNLNPALYQAIHCGPLGAGQSDEWRRARLQDPASFQSSDVAFMAHSAHPLNTNQPGTGKTLETIACLFESGYYEGPKLIIAPLTSMDTVWHEELKRWGGDQPIYMPTGSLAERTAILADVKDALEAELDFWVVVNHDMIKMSKVRVLDESGEWIRDDFQPKYPQLFDVEWTAVVLDEFHKSGATNSDTMAFRGLSAIKGKKKIGLSGTPMGGQPIKLWAMLHWLYPNEFPSKWNWANAWLNVEIIQSRNGAHRKIGDIKPQLREAFNDHISPYLLRRTKEEVLPWLPAKQYIDLGVEMDEKQAAQYRAMAEDAEWRMDEDTSITATSILAEYMRLKQFANAYSELGPYIDKEMRKRKVIPTMHSCKLPIFMQLLEERGIKKGELEGDEQVVFFSQFSEMVDMVCDYLEDQGIPTSRITGNISKSGRDANIREFRGTAADRPRVMGITTTAGGVSINLDTASTVVFFDETWNPDDQEQAEDRCHRASRIHQVTIYKIYTKGTIEQYIRSVINKKDNINKRILDLRRSGLRSV